MDPDPGATDSSDLPAGGGTIRWMAPELLDPEKYGFRDGRPTRHSDCYALGMVVYEVLSGRIPFDSVRDLFVMERVVQGERPEREECFSDHIWNVLENCWNSSPGDRPSVEDVLQCLEEASRLPWILPHVTDDLSTGWVSEVENPRADSGDEELGGGLIAIPPIIYPSIHHSSAPSSVPGFQPLGIDTSNPSLPAESERGLGRVS